MALHRSREIAVDSLYVFDGKSIRDFGSPGLCGVEVCSTYIAVRVCYREIVA